MTMKDNRTYLGQWKNDVWNGQGKLETPHFTYTGAFVRGLFEGKGKIEYKDESVYEGMEDLPSSLIFPGTFRSGLRHGKGKFTSKVQRIASYNGDWTDDLMEGAGEIQFATGDTWVGPVHDGQVCFFIDYKLCNSADC